MESVALGVHAVVKSLDLQAASTTKIIESAPKISQGGGQASQVQAESRATQGVGQKLDVVA